MMVLLCLCASARAVEPVADVPFVQEYAEHYPLPQEGEAREVRAVAVDGEGTVWAGTKSGLYALSRGAWRIVPGVCAGPLYTVFLDGAGAVWAGAWDGIYHIENGAGQKAAGVDGTIAAIRETPQGLIALGPEGSWMLEAKGWRALKNGWARHVRDVAVMPDGSYYIGTGVGLYHQGEAGLRHYYRDDELYSGDIRALAIGRDGDMWIGAKGGIDRYSHGSYRAHYGAKEGLPNFDVRALAVDSEGTVWAGTALGVARFDGKAWSLRHSKRWLLSDDVRDIAFDSEGTAWIATGAGVSAIKRKTMTLAEKAQHYLDICHARHVRPPYAVEKCRFPDVNDLSKWEPWDDDNDGTFTAMYMAMESLRWAVTQDPEAKEHARKAYDFLQFLEEVTPIDGFFARTVVPSDWTEMADKNHTMTPEEYAERRVRDPRTKRVDERWRLSEDGKWLWKGDTSSDEMVGHMFGYYFYFTLVADDAEKPRVSKHVAKIVDYIVDNGYVIRDLDGVQTRWGVWAPEIVKGDPDWRVEGVNKTYEALSWLRCAYHITGGKKYERKFRKLYYGEGYGEIAKRPKSYGRSERTHIQDDLLAMSTPALILTESDPVRRAGFLEGATWAYKSVEHDQNLFFNFIYGMAGGANFHLEESVAFMRDQPLDLRHYTVDNATREDITLVREPIPDQLQTSRMLPPSERGVMRWDKNPWEVVSGDFGDPDGHLESSGVFWLLPYWMARYEGWIAAP
ncbi:MAG: regulator [Candidatus Hydrogenedentes bacterium]|nr:regulator [Candidatus Hydrogenedentota bacterium]